MSDRTIGQQLGDAVAERDRLADAVADLTDRHRRHHRNLATDGCATCQILRATDQEPAVEAAYTRARVALTSRIERRINKIPRETTHA